MTDERIKKITRMAEKRQTNLAIFLENVHDPHNIGAVLRTCDAVGIFHVYILNTDYRLPKSLKKFDEKASSGARKWVNLHFYTDTDTCFADIKKNYVHLYASNLNDQSTPLYNLDFTSKPSVLMFGNEHEGLTPKALAYRTHSFHIPQVGMVQSLNISVACAVSLYEAFRQKSEHGDYAQKDSNFLSIQDHYLNPKKNLKI